MHATILCAATVEYAPIAISGERGASLGYGPGLGTGVYFSFFRATPVVNQSGDIAFRGSVSGDGVDTSNNAGIWKTSGGALQLVAREGATGPGPGLGPGVYFDAPSTSGGFGDDPILNAAGAVFFPGSLAGPGVTTDNSYGRWTDASGFPEPVARQGSEQLGPNLGDGVVFTYPGGPAFNSQGRAAFLSGLSGTGIDAANDQGIWLFENGSLTTIARTGPAGPDAGLGPDVHFNDLDYPILNDQTEVVFRGQVAGVGVDASNDRGIWSYYDGSLIPLVREGVDGTLGPNLGSGFTFSLLADPDINAAGDLVFAGTVVDASDGSQMRSIWRDTGGGHVQLIKPGDVVSGRGLQAGTTIANAYRPLVNAKGDVAFLGSITGPGVDGANSRGIFTDADGELVMLARQYNAELGPGAADGAEFYSFSNVMFNAEGDVAFTAELTVEARPHDYGRGDGIWATKDGEIYNIIRVGDFFDADPGPAVDMQEVILFDFLDWDTSAGGNGRKLHFTDDGLLAFALVLGDGSSGIYTARIVADVPLSGDFDGDGAVDGADFLAWQRTPGIGSLDDWQVNYGTMQGWNMATVPEPSALLLLCGMSLGAFAGRIMVELS